MSDELTLVEHRGEHAVLTLNRPEKRNAISRALAASLQDALADLEDKKVIVLTGNGPAFCAGVDLSERTDRPSWTETLGVRGAQYWAETLAAIRRHPAVFIAAVNGYALGGGLTLVNAAELAVAAERAEFGAPEITFGSFPALAGPSTTKRLLPKHAAQLIFTGQRVDAETALRMGLVNEVVPGEALLARAEEMATAMASFNAATLALGKRAFGALQEMGWDAAIDHGVQVSGMVRTLSGGQS